MDAAKLIEALGGTAAVARMARVRAPSVSGWKASRQIPEDRLIRLSLIAEQMGIATRQQLFPSDWRDIWPELADQAGAPEPTAAEPATGAPA